MKTKTNSRTKSKQVKPLDFINKLDGNDALAVLHKLAGEDKNIAKKIKHIIEDFLDEVDSESVAYDVQSDLEMIDVEDVWDRSGSTRDGYIEPTEMAWEMFEEALEPHENQLKKYREFSKHDQAARYCMGILKGIYLFEKESTTEYKDWTVDAPGEYFSSTYENWKKSCRDQNLKSKVKDFIKSECPDWAG